MTNNCLEGGGLLRRGSPRSSAHWGAVLVSLELLAWDNVKIEGEFVFSRTNQFKTRSET